MLVSHVGLLGVFDLGARPWLLLSGLALGYVGLWLAGRKHAGPVGVAGVLLVAAMLRLLLLPIPPTLSDDLLRYIWDGRVATAGFNPYRLEPDAEELTTLRDEPWKRLPHRDVATVYPPLALALFSISARSPWPQWTLKSILVGLDLLTCWLLLRIAGRLRIPRRRVLWYAWNPLVVLEVAGMGHVDALGVCATVLAAWFLVCRPRRPIAAAVAVAAGVLAKLVPLLLLPAWSRRSGRPAVFAAVALGLSILALAPVVIATGGVPPGLVRYGVSWEFNGPFYEPLWRALDGIGAVGAVKGGLDVAKRFTGQHDFWNLFYPFVYPQWMAKMLLAPGLLIAMFIAWRRSNAVASAGIVFSSVALFSATVYPWYLLWTLPWAALCRQRAWLVLSATIVLSYLPQTVGVPYFPMIYLGIWVPFFVLLLRDPKWSTA